MGLLYYKIVHFSIGIERFFERFIIKLHNKKLTKQIFYNFEKKLEESYTFN